MQLSIFRKQSSLHNYFSISEIKKNREKPGISVEHYDFQVCHLIFWQQDFLKTAKLTNFLCVCVMAKCFRNHVCLIPDHISEWRGIFYTQNQWHLNGLGGRLESFVNDSSENSLASLLWNSERKWTLRKYTLEYCLCQVNPYLPWC